MNVFLGKGPLCLALGVIVGCSDTTVTTNVVDTTGGTSGTTTAIGGQGLAGGNYASGGTASVETGKSGGQSSSGGTTDILAAGGTPGGTSATGGTIDFGGASSTGGTLGAGGVIGGATGGIGAAGASSTIGNGTGGATAATGGAPSITGGAPTATGGVSAAGGNSSIMATGGVTATGGTSSITATGGVTATGGTSSIMATGGVTATGGTSSIMATGGVTATGGTSSIMATGGAAAGGQTGLKDKCSLLLHMDEASWSGVSGEVIDSSGSGNNGTALDGATTTASPAKYNRAGAFSGSNYVSIPDSASLRANGAFSVEAWFFSTGFDSVASPGIVTKRRGFGDSTEFTIFVWIDNRIFIDIDGEGDRFSSSATLTNNTWYQVVLVFDGSLPAAQRARLYINGQLDSTHPESSSIVTGYTSGVFVGNLPNGGTKFIGAIDEVAFWQRALSATEVLSLYQSGTPL